MTTRAALKVLGLNGYGRVQNRLTNEGSITGYPNYDDLMNLAKGYFLLDVDHNYMEGRRQVLVQGGYAEHSTSRSDKNDDFAMVARHLLPLAVKYTAAVIARYADDVRLDFPFDHFGHTGDVVSVELVDPPERADTRAQ